jgi:hypothetical protein
LIFKLLLKKKDLGFSSWLWLRLRGYCFTHIDRLLKLLKKIIETWFTLAKSWYLPYNSLFHFINEASFWKVYSFLTLIKMQCNLPIFSTKFAYTCLHFGEQGCVDCCMAAVINVLKIAVIIAWLTVVSDMYFATWPYNWTHKLQPFASWSWILIPGTIGLILIMLYLKFYTSWVIDGPAAILPETQRCQNEKHKLQLGFPCLLPTQFNWATWWQQVFYVQLTNSQLILKEPTPWSWQFAGVQS